MSEERPKQGVIECCVRCVGIIRAPVKATSFFERGRWWWLCTNEAWCNATLQVAQRNHKREIDRRKMLLKPGEVLLVVQDHFGTKYGYGNYYIEVPAGEDPQAAWKARKADDKEDALVLGETIGPKWPYGPPSHHEEVCHLNVTEGFGYCDCKASDASDTEWGTGA